MPTLGSWAASHLASSSKKRAKSSSSMEANVIDLTGEESPGRDPCAICLGELQVASRAKLEPCAHVFCEGCIWRWLERKNACPLCLRSAKAVVHGSKRRRKSIPDPSLVIDSSAQHAADIYRQLNPFRAASRARPSWEDRVDGGVTSRHHAPAGRRVSLYVGRVQRLARSRQRDLGPIASRPSQPASHFNLEEVQWRARVYVLGVWTQPLQGSVDDLPERGAPLRRQQTELRRWVERELWALLPDIDTELIQALVLSLLRTRGSTADTLEALRPFLGSRAGQFWHELRWCETEMACRL